MCGKSLLGLPKIPDLPAPPPPAEIKEEETPAVFETNEGAVPKRGRSSLKRDDLNTGSTTGLSIPTG